MQYGFIYFFAKRSSSLQFFFPPGTISLFHPFVHPHFLLFPSPLCIEKLSHLCTYYLFIYLFIIFCSQKAHWSSHRRECRSISVEANCRAMCKRAKLLFSSVNELRSKVSTATPKMIPQLLQEIDHLSTDANSMDPELHLLAMDPDVEKATKQTLQAYIQVLQQGTNMLSQMRKTLETKRCESPKYEKKN
jgi:hypothetical protein